MKGLTLKWQRDNCRCYAIDRMHGLSRLMFRHVIRRRGRTFVFWH